jgi:peptidoglycan hydrolase-like protein with peptidoglycan-binding domain
MRRHHALPIAATVLSFLLAGCGLDGTDRYREDARAAASPAAVATPAAATDDLVEVDLPDSTPRPTMRLQVVLDSQGFGPGVIDGRDGLSTVNALKGFQEANGLDVTGELDEETKAALARWHACRRRSDHVYTWSS